jgi:peroxiredoxin
LTQTLNEAFEKICLMDAPLGIRLSAYSDKLKELNFPFAEAYEALVARLIDGAIGSTAPGIGDEMPPFLLPGKNGNIVALQDLLAEGPVVISFNRGHWCPFCKIELRALAAFHDRIAEQGGQVISILPDRQQFVDRLRDDTHDRLIILTDIDNGYSLTLGLALWLGEPLKELMRGRGYHLDEYQGNEGWFVPLPATFVVGRNGRILSRHVDPDFRSRLDVGEIIETLKSATV